MSRASISAVLLALFLAPAAAATLPQPGTLVAGRSLAGIAIGEPAVRVRAALGHGYGVCQGCARTTWYFTYRPFEQKGLAVELTRGRVSAVYTLWQPDGWRAGLGLQLGAVEAQVTKDVGATIPVTCSGYDVLVSDGRGTRTAYYIVAGKLWGFGLLRTRANPCR
jgi:hypothetical protein